MDNSLFLNHLEKNGIEMYENNNNLLVSLWSLCDQMCISYEKVYTMMKKKENIQEHQDYICTIDKEIFLTRNGCKKLFAKIFD